MKAIKHLIAVCMVLVICLSLSSSAFALVQQDSSFYVTDSANVLSLETRQRIIDTNGALEAQCKGSQIVVVTVDYLDGLTSDRYAYQIFNDWGIGSSEYNNGMLLLLAVQENKAWLAYGLGLTAVLDEGQVDQMLDRYFWPDFDRSNYDTAVTKLFQALLIWYDQLYGSNVAGSGQGVELPAVHQSGLQLYDRFSGFLRTIVLLAILFALFGGRTRRYGGSWFPWLLFFNSASHRRDRKWSSSDTWPPRGGGFGSGRGFGGGSGRGGGGFSGGGGGRR